MSCNGCRVLRKGCSESCILRPCLQWIDTPEAQGHATVFVAKFFGRAGLMSFISNVSESQRPGTYIYTYQILCSFFLGCVTCVIVSVLIFFFWLCFSALFQSLLFEACGRTVNPVNGAVGLLWTGNWHVCQAAVETVLRGGTLRPMPELLTSGAPIPSSDEVSEAEVTCTNMWNLGDPSPNSRPKVSPKRRRSGEPNKPYQTDLDLRLTPAKVSVYKPEIRRPGTPSMNSEESVTTFESGFADQYGERKLLNLFN